MTLDNLRKEIFEQSAKKLFPYTNPLLNLSVCDIIGKDKEYAKNMAELLLQNSKPFLILNAGVQPEGANAVLEIPEECANISQSFSDEIKNTLNILHSPIHYPHIEYPSSQFSTM
ncbi:hypothetical protein J7M00_02500 [bacterium]|nr:hypothetical protein [bacterium]